jgi:hypothetical protein
MNDETEVEQEEVDEIRDAFDDAVSEDKSEDDVKMALIGAGATFKNVTRLYNQYMVDAGFAVSKEEKDEIVKKILDGKDVSEEAGFNKCVEAIVKKAAGVSEKSASALIRSWAKANDLPYFTKPKGAGGARVGFRSRFFDALIANPAMSKDQCTEYLKTAEGTSNNVMNHESVYQGIRELVNDVYTGTPGGSEQAKAA